MNFIKVEDNLLTKKECTDLIEWVCKNNKIIPHEHKHNWSGYDYHDLMHVGQNYDECFSTIPLRPAVLHCVKVFNPIAGKSILRS